MPASLVSIHGVGTRGQWQEDLHHLFAPHFRHVPLKYGHYLRWGVVAVPLEPWLALGGAGLVAVLHLRGSLGGWETVGAVLVVLGIALLGAGLRLRLARDVVRRQLGNLPSASRAHLIAHSYGTFLSTTDLARHPDMRYGRVIFAGSVVPRRFDWAVLQKSNDGAFQALWNEIGREDGVVPLAQLASWLGTRLGTSGVHGFLGAGDSVHNLPDPYAHCATCHPVKRQPDSWVIHNVVFPHYTHSEHFIGIRHAIAFWLPFLWSIPPAEFRDWLAGAQAASLLSSGAGAGRHEEVVEEQLLTTTWTWAGGTLDSYLARTYAKTAERLRNNPIEYVAFYRALWEVIARACEAVPRHVEMQGSDPHTTAECRALHPRVAVAVAVARW